MELKEAVAGIIVANQAEQDKQKSSKSTNTISNTSKRVQTDTQTKKNLSPCKVVANVDIGFGNHLYIRGNCSGLTWDKGVVMKPVGDARWEWQAPTGANNMSFEFKVLVNDIAWSSGENYVAIGDINEITPVFN